MRHTKLIYLLLTPILLSFNTCSEETSADLSSTEIQWKNLLEGTDITKNWQPASNSKGNRTKSIGERWSLTNGVLELKRKEVAEGSGGSIETTTAYYDFELQFEFKIEFDSNSGIKYRQLHATGFEYQIIDDANYHDNKVSHRTAELYEIQEEETPRIVKKHGDWNTGKIIAKGNSLEHWLNDQKVFKLEIGSEDWKARYDKSKYHKAGISDYGSHTGFIHIQDHSDTGITFRKMLIRKL